MKMLLCLIISMLLLIGNLLGDIFLHGFQKKTEKTPRHEIEIALQRLHKFVKREEKESSSNAEEP
jgi:hypothetical protein